jgi:hypothetical protein
LTFFNDYPSTNNDNNLFPGVLFMLSLRFIVYATQVLFAQHSHELLTTQGSSSKNTAVLSSGLINSALGNTLVLGVEKKINKNMVAYSL